MEGGWDEGGSSRRKFSVRRVGGGISPYLSGISTSADCSPRARARALEERKFDAREGERVEQSFPECWLGRSRPSLFIERVRLRELEWWKRVARFIDSALNEAVWLR